VPCCILLLATPGPCGLVAVGGADRGDLQPRPVGVGQADPPCKGVCLPAHGSCDDPGDHLGALIVAEPRGPEARPGSQVPLQRTALRNVLGRDIEVLAPGGVVRKRRPVPPRIEAFELTKPQVTEQSRTALLLAAAIVPHSAGRSPGGGIFRMTSGPLARPAAGVYVSFATAPYLSTADASPASAVIVCVTVTGARIEPSAVPELGLSRTRAVRRVLPRLVDQDCESCCPTIPKRADQRAKVSARRIAPAHRRGSRAACVRCRRWRSDQRCCNDPGAAVFDDVRRPTVRRADVLPFRAS